ncbi:MAG: hypothetical protein ABIL66_05580 [candidate division WOR-3 bacterium]
MEKVIKGIVKDKKIILEKPVGLPDGSEVGVILISKYRILRHAGVWKDRKDIDDLLKEIYAARSVKSEKASQK